MPKLLLYPAIDLVEGHCLRLRQGDAPSAEAEERFDGDPLATALQWRAAGATWLHIADLDGVLAGEPRHLELVGTIARETGLAIQTGGGLRTEAAVEAAFATGAERVLLGTAALANPELLAVCLNRWGRRIAVSVDSRGGRVTVAGWLENSAQSALEFAGQMDAAGVQTLVMTNLERDGTLAGPDLTALAAARAALPRMALLAAGAIISLDDLRALARAGLDGAVLGRALYDGTLDLAAALSAVANEPAPPDSGATARSAGEALAENEADDATA
jgi:phosphoribosylformimino-5-aminoimidazole carboxamide ribotide isomerase